jgi:hypothetical protein
VEEVEPLPPPPPRCSGASLHYLKVTFYPDFHLIIDRCRVETKAPFSCESGGVNVHRLAAEVHAHELGDLVQARVEAPGDGGAAGRRRVIGGAAAAAAASHVVAAQVDP